MGRRLTIGNAVKATAAGVKDEDVQKKTARLIERDLSLLTGPELVIKYRERPKEWSVAFEAITGRPVAQIAATHNPFFHYAMAVWFDNPDGRKLIYPPRHKDEMADLLLRTALGEFDAYDGVHVEWPRRALKSTWLMAFSDWVPKREKLIESRDVTLFYWHNSEEEAIDRIDAIKIKNMLHPYVADVLPEFRIPSDVEWGTRAKWNWPCRAHASSVTEYSMRAMSIAAKKAGKGANYQILDDLEDEDSWESELIRNKTRRHYLQLRKMKAVPFSREVSAGTPYHLHSLYKVMREAAHDDGTPRYKTLIKPGFTEDNRENFPTIPSLTVANQAKERANEIEQTGSDVFWYLQIQLDPRLTGTMSMQWEWFQKMTVEEWRRNWTRLPHFRCVFSDSAWKGDENQMKGDYTVIQVVDLYQRGPSFDRIILDQSVSREWTSDEGAQEMCRLMKKWQTPYWQNEQISEKTFVGTMRVVARSQIPPMFPVFIDVKGWSKKKKAKRISAVASAARMGMVYYLEGLPYLEVLKEQVENDPMNVHDDALDCFGNTFADEILTKWVPVAMDLYVPPEDQMPHVPAFATRYTGLPLLTQ